MVYILIGALIIGFALTTAITMAVGTHITYGVIRRYLDNAQMAQAAP